MKHLPNVLTLLRLVLAPVVAWLLWMAIVEIADPWHAPPALSDGPAAAEVAVRYHQQIADYFMLAAILFVVSALSDLFDGILARALNAQSKFGRLIDPIADKALVGLPLIVVAFAQWRAETPIWPLIAAAVAIIVVRDVTMTLLRFLSPDGEGARVSSLAKIKTALELIVVGTVVVGGAIVAQLNAQSGGYFPMPAYAELLTLVWLAALVLAAALSVWTAFQYLRPKRRP